jgi:hypothetical protein
MRSPAMRGRMVFGALGSIPRGSMAVAGPVDRCVEPSKPESILLGPSLPPFNAWIGLPQLRDATSWGSAGALPVAGTFVGLRGEVVCTEALTGVTLASRSEVVAKHIPPRTVCGPQPQLTGHMQVPA